MTNHTPTQLVDKYQPLIAFLDTQEGCPKVPWYVGDEYGEYETIQGTTVDINKWSGDFETVDDFVTQPAAVLDSLTVWAMRVSMWSSKNRDLWGSIAPSERHDDKACCAVLLHLGSEILSEDYKSTELATLALLTAICDALGWEGEG